MSPLSSLDGWLPPPLLIGRLDGGVSLPASHCCLLLWAFPLDGWSQLERGRADLDELTVAVGQAQVGWTGLGWTGLGGAGLGDLGSVVDWTGLG